MVGKKKICVIGSGVVGLTTAVKLLENCQQADVEVEVYSECSSPDTTSDVAAGIFYWGISAPDQATTERWAHSSWSHFQALLDLGKPWETGVTILPVLHLSAYQEVTRPLMSTICSVYRDATKRELDLAQPEGKFKHGKYFHTVQIDTETYLAYLRKIFERKGGKVHQIKVGSLKSLQGKCDLVVNCAGLGSRQLAGDSTLVPLRGQILQVEAPWVKMALYCDDIYIIPGQKYVTVGGTRQYNDWMTEISPHDSARIWSRAVSLFPNLSQAKILRERVGLRPHRPCARVELELLGDLPVVHNYGHCGYGVMASPATSEDAVNLVNNWFRASRGRL